MLNNMTQDFDMHIFRTSDQDVRCLLGRLLLWLMTLYLQQEVDYCGCCRRAARLLTLRWLV
jgi:hypothetical protein